MTERAIDISLHHEPEEDILLLGLMQQDVGIMASMLRSLPAQDLASYRGNLVVCRGAAERLKQRCTRLLGDGETRGKDWASPVTGGRSAVKHGPENGGALGTANAKPKSRKRSPEVKAK